MEKIRLTETGNGYSIATVGDILHFEGKAFFKDLIKTTSMEISIGSLEVGEKVPFFHKHKFNEEVYIVLKGKGIFSLDGKDFEVSSGSFLRISPQVSRSTRNTGETPLIYLCIQAKENSLEGYTNTDGIIEQ